MPWNNQGGGGPWGGGGSSGGGGGGGGPWGQRPGGGTGGGPTPPPNLEDMLRKSQDQMRRMLPGGLGTGRGIAIVVVVLLVLWGASGFYRVQADEAGVQLMFGEWIGEPTAPGLHWWPPSPIGDVLRPKVTVINRVNVGFRDRGDNVASGGSRSDLDAESLMLTGDQNIADVEFTVQWRIANAGEYLFNIRAPEETVKVAAESAMREVVGQTKLDDLITSAREEVQGRTRDLLQRILDDYGSGISIERVQLQRAEAPPEVIDAFNDVERARQDKERLQNQAEAYANRIVPTARGEASSVIQQATAYKERVVKEAQGESARFIDIYNSYKTAPEVTRRRLYIETLRDVLAKANKVIIDDKGSGQGVVPYLPLNELQRSRSATGDK